MTGKAFVLHCVWEMLCLKLRIKHSLGETKTQDDSICGIDLSLRMKPVQAMPTHLGAMFRTAVEVWKVTQESRDLAVGAMHIVAKISYFIKKLKLQHLSCTFQNCYFKVPEREKNHVQIITSAVQGHSVCCCKIPHNWNEPFTAQHRNKGPIDWDCWALWIMCFYLTLKKKRCRIQSIA